MKRAIRQKSARSERAARRAFGAVVSALALALAGCGYHFAAQGSALPSDAKTIYVERFGNRTRVTGINDVFMRYLKDEISNRKRLQIVDSPQDADLMLTGDITFDDSLPVAFNAAAEPTLYTGSISAAAALIDEHTHRVLWSSRGISASQNFPVVAGAAITTSPYFLQQNLRSQDIAQMPNIQVAQTQEATAQSQEMQFLAQNLYDSMSEGF